MPVRFSNLKPKKGSPPPSGFPIPGRPPPDATPTQRPPPRGIPTQRPPGGPTPGPLRPALRNQAALPYALLVTEPKNPEDNFNSVYQMLYQAEPLRRYFIDNGATGVWHKQLSTMFKYMASKECKTFSDSKTILLVAGDAQSEQNIQWLFDDGKVDGLPVPRDDAQMCLSNLWFDLMEEAFTVRPLLDVRTLERAGSGIHVWDTYDYHEPKAYLDHMLAVQLGVRRSALTCGHRKRSAYDEYHLKVEPDAAPRAHKVYPLSYYLKELMQGETYQTFDPCETCGLEQTVNQDMSVTRFPPYLLVYLNRFKPGENKQNRWVDIDERVEQCGQVYVLVSVVIHKGSAEKGIFWTVVRERKDYWVVLTDQWIVKGLDNVRAKELLKRFALVAMYKRVGVNAQATDPKDNDSDDGSDESDSEASDLDLSKLLPGLTQKKSKSPQVSPRNVAQQVDKHPYCGLSGTPDNSVTYSNSILQVLYTCTPLREYLIKHSNYGTFHQLLAELFTQMKAQSRSQKNPFVDPELKFNPQFRLECPQFTSGQMHDAYAYMFTLIELIHAEANVVSRRQSAPPAMETADDVWNHHVTYCDNSYISRLFLAQAEMAATCKRCRAVNRDWLMPWKLQLDLGVQKRKVALEDLLKEWDFTSRNTSNCPTCKRSNLFHKELTFINLPYYLVIHLKRFNQDGTKNERQVSILKYLKVESQDYVLSSVVCHYQAGDTGHYVTVVRDGPNQWVLLDNVLVNRIADDSTALGIINSYAYVCTYEAVLPTSTDL